MLLCINEYPETALAAPNPGAGLGGRDAGGSSERQKPEGGDLLPSQDHCADTSVSICEPVA